MSETCEKFHSSGKENFSDSESNFESSSIITSEISESESCSSQGDSEIQEKSCEDSESSNKRMKTNSEPVTEPKKLEETNIPAPTQPQPVIFGSKSVFGSAAKGIVSFSSVSSGSNLPVKNLFAEECKSTVVDKNENDFAKIEAELLTGEEEEISIYSAKGKLFEFNSDSKDWHERGVGILKLNKSKNSDSFRLIMRTEGVQKLILNSKLFQGMISDIVQEKNLRFSASNFESKILTFILRMKSAEEAESLQQHIKSSIDSLKTEAKDC